MPVRMPFVVAVIALLLVPGSADAHPLGNFTVNRFTALEIGLDNITIRYTIDMAEIPTFQEFDQIDSDGDDFADATELSGYAQQKAEIVRSGLTLLADREPLALEFKDASARLRPGQGGLKVARVDVTFDARLPDGATLIAYRDLNFTSIVGWKEIVAYPVDGQGFRDATVPASSISNELRDYPKRLLSDPLDVIVAGVSLQPGAAGAAPAPGEGAEETASMPELLGSEFASLVERDLSPLSVIVALILALGFGAIHALGPGHGKTVMAAYLLGAGGRARHALVIGVAVSLMYTASVIALGLMTLWLAHLFSPEAVLPWLALISGGVVVVVGGWLLRTRLTARRNARGSDLGPRDQLTDADHRAAHATGREHHHHVPEESPFSRKGLVAIAVSGGLLPSPTALVVLLGAIALHRVAFGVALVGAFSIGLAGALAVLGVLVLKARSVAAQRWGIGPGSALPILSSVAIIIVGTVLTARAALVIW